MCLCCRMGSPKNERKKEMAQTVQLKCRALNYLLLAYCKPCCTQTHTPTHTPFQQMQTQTRKYPEMWSGWITVCNMALFNPSNPNKENKLYRHNFTHFHISLLRLTISTPQFYITFESPLLFRQLHFLLQHEYYFPSSSILVSFVHA